MSSILRLRFPEELLISNPSPVEERNTDCCCAKITKLAIDFFSNLALPLLYALACIADLFQELDEAPRDAQIRQIEVLIERSESPVESPIDDAVSYRRLSQEERSWPSRVADNLNEVCIEPALAAQQIPLAVTIAAPGEDGYNPLDEFWKPIIPARAALEISSPAKRAQALSRLQQIEQSLKTARPMQFEICPEIAEFNLDEQLKFYSKKTPVNQLYHLLNFAGPEVVDYKINQSTYAHLEKVKQAAESHATRCQKLQQIFKDHETGIHKGTDFKGPKVEAAEKTLSQLYNILANKVAKVHPGPTSATLKDEIRFLLDAVIDSYEDCIDQINAQLEWILIRAITSELAGSGLNQINIFAAHALFQYRTTLLTSVIYKQNPNERHLADYERAIKARVAEAAHISSRVTALGAHYNQGTLQDVAGKANRAIQEFNKQYHSAPARGADDFRPFAYLTNGLKAAMQGALTESLRKQLIEWCTKEYGFACDHKGNLIHPDAADLLASLSADPENDITIGGDFSQAGIYWLLEAAGVTKQAPQKSTYSSLLSFMRGIP